jgi:plasmid maintenance system antidote protein VapI
MFDPPHPGETLKEDILPDLGLTVADAAQQLGVFRAVFSRVINGRAETWLRAQLQYDLWQAEQKSRPVVKPAGRRAVGA